MSRIDLPDPRRSGAASSGASARIRSRSRRGQCLIIGGVCLLAVLIERWTSFELDWRSWGALSFVVAFIGVLSAFYTRVRRIDDGRLGETLHELAIFLTPDGHFKFPHLWPPKFPRQDRRNYAADGAVARRAAASRSR